MKQILLLAILMAASVVIGFSQSPDVMDIHPNVLEFINKQEYVPYTNKVKVAKVDNGSYVFTGVPGEDELMDSGYNRLDFEYTMMNNQLTSINYTTIMGKNITKGTVTIIYDQVIQTEVSASDFMSSITITHNGRKVHTQTYQDEEQKRKSDFINGN